MSDAVVTANELPVTWLLTALGEVTEFGTTEKAEPSDINADDWLLELEDIEKDSSRLLARVTFNARQSKSSKNRFDTGDVLYGKLRPYLNKVLIADRDGYCTTEIIPLKSGAHLDSRYLFYALKHPAFLAYVEAESHGMNMPRLGTEAGRAAPIVLAPRAEQTRIADQLDTQLARINACNGRFNAIPALLKRFRQAVLTAATSGELTADLRHATSGKDAGLANDGWRDTVVGKVISDLRYGTSKKCSYAPGGIGVLRIPNIADHGQIDISDLKRAEFQAGEIEALSLIEGDLLVIRSNGSVDLVGKTSIVTKRERGLLFAGYLLRLRVNTTLAVPDFVRLCLTTPSQRARIEQTAKSTSGVNNLNATELKAMPIRLPSIKEQTEIVSRVEALFALADRIEARCNAARAKAQRLTPLLLAKAFRGELVPQDPNDEPASVLLERIQAERDANAAGAPNAQRKPRAAAQAKVKPKTRAQRKPKESAAMTKSRQDDDVKGKPYLAGHLRRMGAPATAGALFKAAELPVADFYKQLAWEVGQGHIKDNKDSATLLEAGDAAR